VKQKPNQQTRAMHAKVAKPEHRRKAPAPQIDPELARQRRVRHAIEDRMIERELGIGPSSRSIT